MREVTGDLFGVTSPYDAIVIPTNTTIKGTGSSARAVMGAGVAWTADRAYPGLSAYLARRIRQDGGEHVYVYQLYGSRRNVVCLPTKRDWRRPSDPNLIADMLDELIIVARSMGWGDVALPRLGCGLGGLNWEEMVRPLLAAKLNDTFVVVTP